MADFCNQCAKDLGFPKGDFISENPNEILKEGYGYAFLCEGCGPCLVNPKGDCIDPECFKNHGEN